MRRIRFTLAAASELAAILDYIAARSPGGAKNVQRRIQKSLDLIADLPEVGLAGRNRPGMRRVFAGSYPYLIDYRFTDNEVVIHDVRHTARQAQP